MPFPAPQRTHAVVTHRGAGGDRQVADVRNPIESAVAWTLPQGCLAGEGADRPKAAVEVSR